MIFATLAAASVAIFTPGSQVGNDLRCLAVITTASETMKSEEEKSGMLTAALYFFGKIDGEAPGINLEEALVQVVTAPDFAKSIPDELRRCGAELSSRGQALSDIGHALSKRGF